MPKRRPHSEEFLEFLYRAGHAGRLIRDHGWEATPLGAIALWPQSLKLPVGLILLSPLPMVLLWGSDGYMIYNHAYGQVAGFGDRALLGRKVRDAYPESAAFHDQVIQAVLAGQTLSYADHELAVTGAGSPGRAWADLSYSPVPDEYGMPAAVLGIVVERTEHVLAERRSLAERQRILQMFDQGPSFSAVLEGPEHRYAFVNASHRRLLGDRDVLGKTVAQAIPEAVEQGYVEVLDRVFSTGETYSVSGRRFGFQPVPGGPVEERFLDLSYQPITDTDGKVTGIFVTGVDVTSRMKAEASLHELNQTLERRIEERTEELLAREVLIRTFFEHSSECHVVFVVDDQGRFRYEEINPATLRLYQSTREQIVGKTVEEVFGAGAGEAIASHIQVCLTTGQPHRYRRRLGTSVVEAVATPVPHLAGGRRRILVSAHDITDKAAQEAALLDANKRLEEMATTDMLTGLPNRLLLVKRLTEAIERCAGSDAGVTVLYLDLDRFKPVNDLLGHAIGDTLLIEVAARLTGCIRDTDTLARLGGDEFAIVLPISSRTDTIAVAERINAVMAAPFDLQNHELEVGISIGITQYPGDGLTADELLRCADIAMYRCKTAGAAFSFFEGGMQAELQGRQALEHDLRHAIERDELELHYQPIANCVTGELTGFEALLRWHHPLRGLIAPGEFIPIAEETGLIVPIGQWIMQTACREAASWPGRLRVAVNLSPLQLRQRNLPDEVTAILLASGLSPERLNLEITEGVLIDNPERAMSIMAALKTQGVRISLDDFGTGHSGLSYLRRFPFDTIKVDREFTAGLGAEPEADAIIDAVAVLARRLNLEVIAEGVETEYQLSLLRDRSYRLVQGFLIGRPVPAGRVPDVTAWWPPPALEPYRLELAATGQ